jgi:hypothetical protein
VDERILLSGLYGGDSRRLGLRELFDVGRFYLVTLLTTFLGGLWFLLVGNFFFFCYQGDSKAYGPLHLREQRCDLGPRIFGF